MAALQQAEVAVSMQPEILEQLPSFGHLIA